MSVLGGLLEGVITTAIILLGIAAVYAVGRWVKRQIEGRPGDWVAAKLAGLWRRIR